MDAEPQGPPRLVRVLLWTQIAARVPSAERDTVRRVVGENTSLHEELIRTRSCLEEAAAGEGPVRHRPRRAPPHPEAAGESRAAPED